MDTQGLESETLRVQDLINTYPYGVLIYSPPIIECERRIQTVLQRALPNHLVIVRSMPLYPQDIGIQVGGTFYLYQGGFGNIQRAFKQCNGLSWEAWCKILPEFQSGFLHPLQDGGRHIQIPNTNYRLLGIEWLDLFERVHFNEAGIIPIDCSSIYRAMKVLYTFCLDRDKKLYWGHIDLVLTAFRLLKDESIHLYVDDLLMQFTRFFQNYFPDPLFCNAFEIPHEYTLQGACNIEYVNNGSEWVALVPSFASLGPLGNALLENSFNIVELGQEQFAYGAGIKCRSLQLRWREDIDF